MSKDLQFQNLVNKFETELRRQLTEQETEFLDWLSKEYCRHNKKHLPEMT